MPWVVFALIALLLAVSLSGHDLSSLGYLRSVFALLVVYFCWSAVINTSLSQYLAMAITLVQSPTAYSYLSKAFSWVKNWGMVVATLASLVWLLRRAMQVLNKPVPTLIGILGVDVPEQPDLTLLEIRSDAATLTWAPPSPSRPVQRYKIEVNGITVGESASQDKAITVTGLKPSHFYNIRVIAESSNNFRIGSRVIRIETHSPDGRPNIDPRLVPDTYFAGKRRPRQNTDPSRDGHETKVPSVETANLIESGLGPSGSQGARRNTIGRKHSPSTASTEQPAPIKESRDEEDTDACVAALTNRLDQVRRETDEVAEAIAVEEEGHKRALTEFKAQKEEQQSLLKERLDTSRRLKSDMSKGESAAQEANKTMVQKRKAAEKERNDGAKMEDRLGSTRKDIERMETETVGFARSRETLQRDYEKESIQLRDMIENTRLETAKLEKDLKEGRERLKSLEAENKDLPSCRDDQAWKEKKLHSKHEIDRKTTGLSNQLAVLHRRSRDLERNLAAMQANPQHVMGAWAGQMKDRDFGPSGQIKRRGRATTSLAGPTGPIMSPTSMASAEPYPATSSSFTPTRATAPPPGLTQFAEAPSFLGQHGQHLQRHTDGTYDNDMHTLAGPPLSPGAAAFLPQGILGDEDGSLGIDTQITDTGLPADMANIPQSPASSSRSLPHVSSPRGSASHLPFASDVNERTSNLNLRSSPSAPPPARASTTQSLMSNIFPTSWQRGRGGKSLDEGGPPLGTLKSGQSQSFPRQTDDDAVVAKKKIGFGAQWNPFNRNSVGPEVLDGATMSPSRFYRGPFNNSSTGVIPLDAADASSPRPASMASSDLPRPSTDSGQPWAGFPIPEYQSHQTSRFWGHSRNQSRRTSVHAPTTTLASEDDIILDKEDLAKPEASPSQIGVIGSRPQRKSLNPAASSFMGAFMSRSKPDKEAGADEEAGGKTKAKKDKAKDKKKAKRVEKEAPETTPDPNEFQFSSHSSPTESRKFSMDDRTSVSMSESHESFSLDTPHSNTPSEANGVSPAAAVKDQENVVKKLFRKGSASKFAGKFSKDSGVSLFKKGPSSVATNGSERAERSSIISEADDGDDAGANGPPRSMGSATSSPNLAPTGSVKGRWNQMFRKKGREKESFELDRDDASVSTS